MLSVGINSVAKNADTDLSEYLIKHKLKGLDMNDVSGLLLNWSQSFGTVGCYGVEKRTAKGAFF